MTIFSCNLAPDSAELAMDTLDHDHQGAPMCFTTKFYPLPMLPALLALRGPVVILHELVLELALTAIKNFDDVMVAAPSTLRRITGGWGEHRLAGVVGVELFAAGWSASRKRMVIQSVRTDGADLSEGLMPDGFSASPKVTEDPRGYEPVSAATFVRVANQQAITRERPSGNAGGDLVFCRVTSKVIAMGNIYRFHDADDQLAAMPWPDPFKRRELENAAAGMLPPMISIRNIPEQ